MQHRDAAALTSRSAPAPASPARPNLSPGQDCSLIGTPYAMTLFPFRPYFLKFAKRFTVRVDGIKPEGPWSAYMKHVQERRRNPFVSNLRRSFPSRCARTMVKIERHKILQERNV